MPGLRRDLGLLRDRRFALLLAARTISVLGTAFAPVALAFGVLGLPGATATTLSAVLTAEALPMVLFMLVGGVIADRLPRHRVMMVGESLNAAAYFCLAAMMLTGWTPLPALVTASAVSGIASAVLFPALTGIIPDVVPADRLQTANALLGLGQNIARVTGLVLSGAAVVLLGGGWALTASGAMFAVAAVLIALLRLTPAERAAGGGHSVLAELRDGWREFVSRQWLWVVVAQFSVLVMALQAAHGVLGPLVAKQSLGGAPAWSAVLAGEAVGMIVGVVVTLRLRPRRPILFATLLTLPTAAPYVLLGLSAPLWTVVGGAFVMGVCFDIFGVLWQTTMQREIPAESLSRVSSYDALGSLMFGPLGLLLAGPVAIGVGPRPALVACGAVIILVTLAALLAPGVRGLRVADDEPAGVPAATR
ncbi:Predicted arabinose efflux permease, MFS family [Microbispora rosea]|uniref:Predicted arabinose efflux permease, MFS family n=1 Tax=Microbispora rosea TaxID=58117 RepID=A0A1N7DR75_9ACTN|nr:MFS transporter [Microbispora rosea]GIH49252.1 MFS transporter [Microbispora rosea subsp. rosea]SIR78320.1 Predicted arabinose efflux permease, MFS family [Microbispora rosea]